MRKTLERPFSASQLDHLRNEAVRMGGLTPEPRFVVWTRRGVDARAASSPDAPGFTPDQMFELGPGAVAESSLRLVDWLTNQRSGD